VPLRESARYFLQELRTVSARRHDFYRSWPVVGLWMGLFVAASYRVIVRHILPRMEKSSQGEVHATAPMADDHNAFWGLNRRFHSHASHPKALMSDTLETGQFNKPVLVVSEQSEAFPDADWSVMQVVDTDPSDLRPSFYRSLHMSPREDRQSTQQANNLALDTQTHVKCIDLTRSSNCIVDNRTMLAEYARKLLIGLSLTRVLMNPHETMLPRKFTDKAKELRHVLLVGLGGGALPTYVTRTLPHFHVDVCEVDPVCVRLARQYFGLIEDTQSLRVFVEDGAEFMRSNATTVRKQYDVIMLDAWDQSGRIPIHLSRLEFLNNVRRSLTDRGILIAAIPNHDTRSLAATIANWRLVFDNRSVVLLHCRSTPITIAMTFSDSGGVGMPKFGTVGGREEFKELIRAFLMDHPTVKVDLTKEVTEDGFQQLIPGKRYLLHNVKV